MDSEGLIQQIDTLYFEDEKTFNLDHLTNVLPSNLTSEYLVEYKGQLEKLLTVVTRKVSELILSHQPTYVDELQRIADLQKSITESIRVCTQGRSYLRYIKDGAAKNGSVIIEHYKKRQSLAKLLDSLSAINELRKSVFEIRSLIESQEDFPKAIKMCKDGKSLLTAFQKYKCVNELGLKLNDTIELIGEQVDVVLSSMCLFYDETTYSKLQASYVLMDRSEIAVDQLLMHFCSAINSQAYSVLMKHLELHSSSSGLDELRTTDSTSHGDSNQAAMQSKLKKDFQELCRMLPPSRYLACMIDVCTTFWSIMLNYKRILRWHNADQGSKSHIEEQNEGELASLPESNSSFHVDKEKFKRVYVEQKLIGGLNRLWYDMKRKLSLIVMNHDFSSYRFDEFIKVLSVIDLIVRMGEEFCQCPLSRDLQDCINTQASNFFNAYHKSSIEELKMFLENELWDEVPVKSDFKLAQLKEFSFLRTPTSGRVARLANHPISHSAYLQDNLFFSEEAIESQNISADEAKPHVVIPFEKLLQTNLDSTEDLFASDHCDYYREHEDALLLEKISLSTESDNDFESELNKDFVEENEFISSEDEILESSQPPRNVDGKNQSKMVEQQTPHSHYALTKSCGPILTNSSLNVLRLFGRYIQMMNVLEPISYEILMKIYSLLDHYTMVVYKKFGPDRDRKPDDKNVSPKLKTVIRSIRESLIGQSLTNEDLTCMSKTSETNLAVQQGVPNLANIINSDLALGNLRSDSPVDPRKAVAVESLIYLVNQLWNLQEYLESLIPADLRPQLREQFSQSHSIVPDFLKARAEMNSSISSTNN